jgi:hypothetical protein
MFADEAEAQQHSKLEKLHISTRAAKVIPMTPTLHSRLGVSALSRFCLLTQRLAFSFPYSTSKGI